MSQPPKYTPQHSFVADSATLANFPGQQLDVEFQSVKTTTDGIEANLKLIQRDDGVLANGSVGYEQLAPSLQTNGLAPAAAWATGIAYALGISVMTGGALYRCLVAHTSGVFATDLAAGKWLFVTAVPVPPPSPATLGGVKSIANIVHQWLDSIGTDGTVTQSQPAFSDLSGVATVTQGGTGQTTASAGFGALSPTTTRGDLVVRGAAVNQRLALGTSGYALLSNGTDPAWGAVLHPGDDATLGKVKAGDQSWLEALISSTLSIANASSVSPSAGIGVLGASRTSDGASAGSQGSQAISGFAINNNATQVQTAYAGYFEARRSIGAGATHGIEVNPVNLGSVVSVDPYNMVPSGITPALWLSSGRSDVASTTNTSLAIGVINNGTKHNRGIVFASDSLDASSGEADALVLPATYGITWFGSAGTKVARIRSDATLGSTSLVFGNGALFFQNGGGTSVLSINTSGVIKGYPDVAIDVTGGAFNLTGVAGSSTATAGGASALPATPASYIPIKVNGTSFKIPVYS